MHRFFLWGLLTGHPPRFLATKLKIQVSICIASQSFTAGAKQTDAIIFIFFGNDRGGRRRPPAQLRERLGHY